MMAIIGLNMICSYLRINPWMLYDIVYTNYAWGFYVPWLDIWMSEYMINGHERYVVVIRHYKGF
jgi:hypothetical protein